MADIKRGFCRCGMLMTLTAAGDLHCTHCDRDSGCGGFTECARCRTFHAKTVLLLIRTLP